MPDESCELCGKTLYSITTRRVGNHQFCSTCGDEIIIPAADQTLDNLIAIIKARYVDDGFEVVKRQFVTR